MKIADLNKIQEVLTRGVREVIEKDHLERRLRQGEPLRVKFGIDPTAKDLHLGNAVALWKLKEFQDLGHKIVLIIGDFTARIGDPSGRSAERKTLTEKEIKENMKTYKKQIGKFLDLKKAEIIYNSQHLSKLSFAEIYRIAHFFSVNQIFERDMFQERRKTGRPVWLHEFFYPVFQAYDSIVVKADIEIGGSDQLFNMMMGRQLQSRFNQPAQDIITTKLLVGIDGVKKMSKSYGNYIGIQESSNEQYGKIMSIKDELIGEYFELCTFLPKEEIEQIKKKLENKKINPRDAKMRLAREIVKIYHHEKAAGRAEENFKKIFQKGAWPEKMPEVFIKSPIKLSKILLAQKIIPSNAEFRRLVKSRSVEIDQKTVSDVNLIISGPAAVRIGKFRFLKVSFK
ncbi:MAG: tyrosine--tRNA ligase [Patescibacteria group bacterium]